MKVAAVSSGPLPSWSPRYDGDVNLEETSAIIAYVALMYNSTHRACYKAASMTIWVIACGESLAS